MATKYFCDKCGEPLEKRNLVKAEIRVAGYTSVTDSFICEFCESCIGSIIGFDNYEEMKRRKAERQQRSAERRLKNG